MKGVLAYFLYLFASIQISYSQDIHYIQQPAVGVHFLFNAFSYKDSLHAHGKYNYVRAGLALNYLKGFTPRTDININLAGSFLAFPGLDTKEDDKQLLLEADVSLREKIFPGRRVFNPFLQAGLGFSRFAAYYGVYMPAGVGLQLTLPGEAFLLLHGQYRIPFTSNEAGHFYGSLGIAGIIGKKNQRFYLIILHLPDLSGKIQTETALSIALMLVPWLRVPNYTKVVPSLTEIKMG
ncbi:MAG: hypothetical protein ABUM51_00305 [Bacteroidota bacterium]